MSALSYTTATRGRVLDLAATGVRESWWETGRPDYARLAAFGGVAAGQAALAGELGARPDAPALILAVGEAVRRGLPTAARASVLGRAPLGGRLAVGQVGGALGPALAGFADFVLLRGRAQGPGAVLVLRGDGAAELHARPQLAGLAPRAAAAWLADEHGTDAVLSIGRAGERGLPFASLAAGVDSPSFVGRGGLGAVLGALGLKAVVVAGADAGAAAAEGGELVALLARSPRLRARAAGGTFELLGAHAARGDLACAGQPVSREAAALLYEQARAARVERKGCRGCPTPCGWVFERPGGTERQGARFNAGEALGVGLGLARFEDALVLLARCDDLGLDAREAGAVLALLAEEDAALRGDVAALAAELERLVDEPAHPGRAGGVALARARGRQAAVVAVGDQVGRTDSNLAALLGQHVSSGGADPMRSFPFLQELGDAAAMRAVTGLPFPAGAADPHDPRGKGRLVLWCENLATAVDATGFCAFSAAGLLADRVTGVDELAAAILPGALRAPADADWDALSPGERLLALGANLVALRRAVDRDLGATRAPVPGLDASGLRPEYEYLRGTGDEPLGTPAPWTVARGRWLALEEGRGADAEARAPVPQAPGRVTLRASGPLADALGRERCYEGALPTTLGALVDEVARADARAARWLVRGGDVLPSVWRGGQRLTRTSRVADGDVLDLVTAISGG